MGTLNELVEEIEKKRARGEVTDVDEATFNAMDAGLGLGSISNLEAEATKRRKARKAAVGSGPITNVERKALKREFPDDFKKGGSVKSKASLKKTSMW